MKDTNVTTKKFHRKLKMFAILMVSLNMFIALAYYMNGDSSMNNLLISYGVLEAPAKESGAISNKEKISIFENNLDPLYEVPSRLYFEGRSIDIPLIEVGVESDGTLENPADWNTGGWFHRSSMPGQIGNIIINAHYDNNTGAPAAFWELKNAVPNDKVFLVDSLGKIYTYRIMESFYVGIDDPDRLRIFESVEDKSELTLITCGGVWNLRAGTYDKRLVVKAELLDSTKTAINTN